MECAQSPLQATLDAKRPREQGRLCLAEMWAHFMPLLHSVGLFNRGVRTRWRGEIGIFQHQVAKFHALISPRHLVVTPQLNSPLLWGAGVAATTNNAESHLKEFRLPQLKSARKLSRPHTLSRRSWARAATASIFLMREAVASFLPVRRPEDAYPPDLSSDDIPVRESSFTYVV